jgi:uncharacterized protein (TIGR03083 family)
MAGTREAEYRRASEAFARQASHIYPWVEQLTTEELAAPSVLPQWNVATVVAHLVMIQEGLVARLAQTTNAKPLPLADYLASYVGASQDIADRTRAVLASHTSREMVEALAASADPSARLALCHPADVIIAGRGPIRVMDWLESRIAELVIHTDDLNRSLPRRMPIEIDREALGRVCRLLIGVLATRAPGKAVEVRIPPYVAVQVVAGVAHTRGTPPNVIEMGPSEWIRLAAGRQSWTELVAAGAVAASGSRADLAMWMPIL